MRYSGLIPQPVVVVTMRAGETTNAIAIGWITPISRTPPLLGIAVAPSRYSHDLIRDAGEFTVNVLTTDQRELSTLSGTKSGRDVEKLELPEFKTRPGKKVSAPQIEGCKGTIECKLVQETVIGDHTMFVGEVMHVEAGHDSGLPLILFGGQYHGLGDYVADYP